MLDELLKYVPKAQHKAFMGFLRDVPHYVRKICVVGDHGAPLGYLLKRRPGLAAYGIVANASVLPMAEKMLDGVVVSSESLDLIPLKELDAVLLCNLEQSPQTVCAMLGQFAQELSPDCHLFSIFGDPSLGSPDAVPRIDNLSQDIETALAPLGFRSFYTWSLVGAGATVDARLDMAVPMAYEPLTHVQKLIAAGEPASAYSLVEKIPRGVSEPAERRVLVYLERLKAIAAWLVADVEGDSSQLLANALESFYFVTQVLPRELSAFVAMAQCWEAVGDGDMAARLRRTIAFAASGDDLSSKAAVSDVVCHPPKAWAPSPRWEPEKPIRVLFLMNPRPHYGIDVLYDGLCTCLGDSNVTDYPFKPWLHGEESDVMKNYPCRFERTGESASLGDILARLDAKGFDLILYADVEGDLPRGDVRAIIERAGDCPVAIVDALDEMTGFRDRVAEQWGTTRAVAYFKREKHRSVDYGDHCYALPFAYDERRALPSPVEARTSPFFWAGHTMFGLRRLYLDTLTDRFGWDLDTIYSPERYIAKMRTSVMGLNCFGMGFDTVRYWELPAQGCMMLSERLPIEIPYNFVDGKQAVFFDDLKELVEKVEYYQAHPHQAALIAQAGNRHYWKYHTNEARARQLLGCMEGHWE